MDPKKKTDGGEGSLHDPLQRKWLRLGEVINLARGATADLKRDWPPPEPWLGHFKDLKAAVEYRELQVAQPPILVNKRTSISLENLSLYAAGQDALWDWLRDFCQRWRAARVIVLEEPASPNGEIAVAVVTSCHAADSLAGKAHRPREVGRPSLETEIEAAYKELCGAGEIDFDAPKKRLYEPIREKIRKYKRDPSLKKGLQDEAIRKVISLLFEVDKNRHSASP